LFVGEKNVGMRTTTRVSIMLLGTTTRFVTSGNAASAGEAGREEKIVERQGARMLVLYPSCMSPKNNL
jgi:hypothetical protein